MTYKWEDNSFFGEMKKLVSLHTVSEVSELLSEERLREFVNFGKAHFFPHLHNSNKAEHSHTGIFQTISISQRERREFGQKLICKEERSYMCGICTFCMLSMSLHLRDTEEIKDRGGIPKAAGGTRLTIGR